MTRETKIGLLVGLAFVIVVGILLSEHLTTTTERPAAALAEAGRGVRQGVSSPGVGMDDDLAKALVPSAPVPTPAEIAPAPLAPPIAPPVVTPAPELQPIHINIAPAPAPVNVAPVVITPVADPFANDPLVQTARTAGEPVVPVTPTPVPEVVKVIPPPAVADNVREYKAQPGDTLSRIAALLPGGATAANRDAVVKLNPTLQKDPNKVIAGRTYLLPTDKAAPKAVAKTAPKAEPKSQSAKADKPTGTRVYTVKRGDTLTKIATEQLGSAKAVTAIRQLNADKIKNDVLFVDMKIKLPAGSVATAE